SFFCCMMFAFFFLVVVVGFVCFFVNFSQSNLTHRIPPLTISSAPPEKKEKKPRCRVSIGQFHHSAKRRKTSFVSVMARCYVCACVRNRIFFPKHGSVWCFFFCFVLAINLCW